MLPKFSIVIPNYNSGTTLERTIKSILVQNYPNLQLIITDSQSTDGSGLIIEKYREHFDEAIIRKDKGQPDGLNYGFERARGDIFGWLCADDELLPGALHHVAGLFEKNPNAGVVTGGCERVFPDGATLLTTPAADTWEKIGYQDGIEQPSTFWRASAQHKAGPLDTTFELGFDWDLWCRLKQSGAALLLTERPLSRYYFSGTNKTAMAGDLFTREAFRIISKYGSPRVARCYRFLYKHFDLHGCYDKPPTCTLLRSHQFVLTLALMQALIGRRRLYLYNWHFASCQQRNLKWW